jgi:hypothetical protein
MKSERAGDAVFTNIDEALAEKIISRSKENCADATPVFGGAANASDSDAGSNDGEGKYNGWDRRRGKDRRKRDNSFPEFPRGSAPVIKIAAVILALAVLTLFLFRRGGNND